jgi:hypothetical protein
MATFEGNIRMETSVLAAAALILSIASLILSLAALILSIERRS